ncbi:MAG: phosphatase PAP2 family protein [Bacteroidota bacterium]
MTTRFLHVCVMNIITVCVLSLHTAAAQSPYRLELGKDVVIFSTGLGAGIAALLLDETLDPLTPEEISALSRDDVNAFDRGATYQYSTSASTSSDILVYTVIASPLAMLIDQRVRNDWGTYLLMYSETLLWTGASAHLVKNTVGRTRPYVYNPEAPMEEKTTRDGRKSFYSSHTAFAFASAVFLSTTYSCYFAGSRWVPYIWACSLTVAALVGFLRYQAGMHYPTDIIVGAGIGALVGYAIPALHRIDANGYSVRPGWRNGGIALNVTMRF